MPIKYDPSFTKELNKFNKIIFIVTVVTIIVTFIVLNVFLSLSDIQLVLFGWIITVLIIFPLLFIHLKKSQKKWSKEEINEFNEKTKEHKKMRYVYLILAIIPSLFGVILILWALNQSLELVLKVLPLFLFCLSLTIIIMGLDFRYNKKYYEIGMFKIYGEETESRLQKMSESFISEGIILIFVSIILFLISTYIL